VFFHEVRTVRVAGFEVTTPAETVLTLAARFPANRIEVFVDETLVRRTAGLDEYREILDRIQGGRVRGSALLRRIVAEREADAYEPPQSELERLSRRLTDRPDATATRAGDRRVVGRDGRAAGGARELRPLAPRPDP